MSLDNFVRCNFWHLDLLIEDNAQVINDPFTWKSRGDYLLDTNGVHDDLCTDGLTKALAEALELPENVSFNDVLSYIV